MLYCVVKYDGALARRPEVRINFTALFIVSCMETVIDRFT